MNMRYMKYGAILLLMSLMFIFVIIRGFTLDAHHTPQYPSAYGKTEDVLQINGTVKAYNVAVNNLKAHEMTVNSRSWHIVGGTTYCWDAVKKTCTGSGSNTCSGPGQDIFVYDTPANVNFRWITTRHLYKINCAGCVTQKFNTSYVYANYASEYWFEGGGTSNTCVYGPNNPP